MNTNKVDFGGKTLIDLTNDTVTPETLAEGVTAHDASGELITGTMTTGGGSENVETCTVEVLCSKGIHLCSYLEYVDGAYKLVTIPNASPLAGGTGVMTETTELICENVVCGTSFHVATHAIEYGLLGIVANGMTLLKKDRIYSNLCPIVELQVDAGAKEIASVELIGWD